MYPLTVWGLLQIFGTFNRCFFLFLVLGAPPIPFILGFLSSWYWQFWCNGWSKTIFYQFYPKWLGCLCFHGGNHVQVVVNVNHRPTGSRLFTLVSLSPRFDYCNCLLTMCSVSFHSSSSCWGRSNGLFGSWGKMIHTQPWLLTLSLHHSPALVPCTGLHTPFTSFVHYVSLVKDISLDFNHGFLWPNPAQCNYPSLFGVLFKDICFHLELLDALTAFLKI